MALYETAIKSSGGICASSGEGSLLGGYTRMIDIEGGFNPTDRSHEAWGDVLG